uniref:Ig-like domain-containing protein n=1 Tax=Oryzias sinensis TaxID=183150 RepID=A0A8C7X6D6_9TELE
MALEGDTVTLSCKYSGTIQEFFWYQQKSSSSPQLLIREYSEVTEKFSVKHDKETTDTSTELIIRELTLADTALYYCARLYKNLKTDMGLLFKEEGSGFQSTASYQMDSVHSCLIRVSVVTAANETLWEDSHDPSGFFPSTPSTTSGRTTLDQLPTCQLPLP